MKGGSTTPLMMEIIHGGIEPLLQLMSVDLEGRFHTGLITTKCLNTAALVMYLASGERGLREAFTCDVDKVIPRYANVFPTKTLNHNNVNRFLSSVSPTAERYLKGMKSELDKPSENGTLHYLMLTDSHMPLAGEKSSETILFPGHVFVIEQRGAQYHLYQSYINAYTMDTQVRFKNNGTTRRSQKWMDRFSSDLRYFVEAKVWDKKCADFWTFLTHTDATGFVGRDKSEIYLCHKAVSSEHAFNNFVTYLGSKEEQLHDEIVAKPASADAVHGNMSLFQRGMRSRLPEHRSKPWSKADLHEFVKSTRKLLVG